MKKLVLALTATAMMCSQNVLAQNKVKNLYTETSSLKVEQVQNTDQTVQVNRYLFAGYNTLCLPMSMSAEQLNNSGIKAERLVAIQQEGNTLQLCFADCTSEGIEAGVPYLIYSEKTQYLRMKNTDAARTTVELKTIRMSDSQGNQVSFSSSWDKRQKDGLYGIPARQDVTPLASVLVRTRSDLSFLPTRCGFCWETQSASASRLEIRHISNSEATAIRSITSIENAAGNVYDLNGRQHNAPVKGINIVNGRKVIK